MVDAGGAYLLPRLVGLPRAKAMVMLGEGCTGKELDYWFTEEVLHPRPSPVPPKPRPGPRMADLPAACRQVLLAP